MKANEVMIGDLVRVTNGIAKVHDIGKIVGVEFIDGGYDVFKIEELEPIPLTPEILEKNGFATNDEQGNWKGYRIYSLFNTDKSCIFMLKLYEKDSIYEISLNMAPYYITFRYVHQLQHLLRLTGYDKEIVI